MPPTQVEACENDAAKACSVVVKVGEIHRALLGTLDDPESGLVNMVHAHEVVLRGTKKEAGLVEIVKQNSEDVKGAKMYAKGVLAGVALCGVAFGVVGTKAVEKIGLLVK